MIVLDASAAIDIAVDNLADPIDELLADAVITPSTFYVETAMYALRVGARRPDVALELRDIMWSLVTEVVAVDERLASESWELTAALSFPDATYVAAARRRAATLWTTDGRLEPHAASAECGVRLLRRR